MQFCCGKSALGTAVGSMKSVAGFLLVGLLFPSQGLAANHTKPLQEKTISLFRPLSLEKVSRIMRSEMSQVYADAVDPVETWHQLLQAEHNRIFLATTGDKASLRRSLLRHNSVPVTPFLICDLEYGVSGQVRRQVLSEQLGGTDQQFMNLYNKDDMSCFALQSTLSSVSELPENFQSVPILPEMKIPQGTMDAIEDSNTDFGRVEAILCPGVHDVVDTLANIEQGMKGLHHAGRALRVQEFAASRVQVENIHHPCHRSLRTTTNCDEMASATKIDTFDDTILFAIPLAFRGPEWRSCLQMLVLDLALRDDVCFVGAYEDPQILNDLASGILQSGSSSSKPFYDVGLNGDGQVVALADSGLDMDNCYFYDSKQSTPMSPVGSVTGPVNARARKVIQYVAFADDNDYSGGHGTHVAGTIAGRRAAGAGDADGVARAAKLAFFDIGNGDNGLAVPLLSTVFATGYNDAGARVHSASWGNPNRNSYSSFDHQADSFMYNNPDFLFVVAAGNSGRDRTSKSIASPGLNKNGITVGASQNSSPHLNSGMLGPNYLAEFSSRGPTGDGRRKPDVVAPGMHIQSARASPNTKGECDDSEGVAFKAGTSMATPAVSGAAALIRQYFEEGWYVSGVASPDDGFSPRASLVKAVLVNGAVELQGVQDDQTKQVSETSAYDMNQGYGRVNLSKSLPIAGKNTIKGVFVNSNTLSTGDTDVYEVRIDHENGCNEPLSVSLVWTDPPVGPMCDESCVLNDLDLSLQASDGAKFYPNGLSKPDDKNNVERIVVDDTLSGYKYTVEVRGKQLVEPQAYSLAITGCLVTPDSAPAPTAMPRLPPTRKPTPTPTASPEQVGPAAKNCADTTGVFSVEGVNRKCTWLESSNVNTINFLCHWMDVAQTCPNTCQVCGTNFDIGNVVATTPRLDGTVRFFGNAFEIRPHHDITLMTLGVHLYGSSTVVVEVWIRGPSSNGWNQMCQSTVASGGRFSIVTIPESDCNPTELAAGTTSEIYVAIESSKGLIMIPDSTWTMETQDFTLSNGAAVSYFDEKRANGYGFDGSIHYARTCKDQTAKVHFSDWAGDRTCSWLAKNLDRMGFSCDFTDIVLHCPLACGRCAA